jgi:hypothetical protein
MIHNPADRLAKLLKQLRGVETDPYLHVEYVISGISSHRKVCRIRGVQYLPMDRLQRKVETKRARRSAGSDIWGPHYRCRLAVAQKPERAVKKALEASHKSHARRAIWLREKGERR